MSTCFLVAFRMTTLDMRDLDTSLDMRDTNLPTSTRVPTPSIRNISQAGTFPVATWARTLPVPIWARRIKIQHAQHISSFLGEALHGPRRVESRLWSFHECTWQLVPLNVHGSWHLVVVNLQFTQLCTRLCTQLHVKKQIIRREREQRPCVYRWILFRRSQNLVFELCSPVSGQKERDSKQIDWKIDRSFLIPWETLYLSRREKSQESEKNGITHWQGATLEKLEGRRERDNVVYWKTKRRSKMISNKKGWRSEIGKDIKKYEIMM